ncbi:hypothetical protein A2380_03700 [candidate division WWE3 bacterium RIFOXYB1_FULL_43_24]|uniref:RNA methyltransferase, TrmH family n=2 Tax=Katanobacteria TaxID=422282 RepID=A0A0G0YQ75_UNCKA|nr:MAG: RNA methyltransferase, TrmH family [candidate division WWE3 bacterium GW2011_GWA1_42_12]KKS38822.1 MAG: RNA methyltransferase, TrmH family [candidate division WWE3 bacterium GW2011_GWF1_42_14]KKS40519.1 MAG: RNA methyltransferase, TrmH family [candidate division WWE3 bacterium GW2011_GWE1_42_16]KKS66007.1 MAG: RNA methyltransferase, TrmH family [candidate division WWE3 bacterium GW2011_GWB1_42_6]OGC60185.1 MAG: hypothetical protein A2212_02785 [candidate division WWE3 bacterium RIFOXYA1
MKLRNYDKNQSNSYCLGVYPTIELFKYKPESIIEVFINPKGQNNSGVKEITKLANKHNVRVEEGQKVLMRLSGKENVYAGARFSKYSAPLLTDKPHVVLVNPENMGNLGTIIRTLHAFGYKNLALIRPAVDIFDPKVIRASMGSVFTVNFEYFDKLTDYTTKFGRELFLLTPKGNITLEELTQKKLNSPEKSSFVFGSESSGFSAKELALGENVKINFSKDVDSLNLSIAVGIVLHSFKLI